MSFPKYSEINATSKSGVNYIRTVVENSNSIFHQFPQENDIGVDALIEIIKDEHPTGKMIAVQIKSGESFFVSGKCVIPIENHRNYWERYPLPVFGIVFIPSLNCAYWVDIKKYLSNQHDTSTIKYEPTKANIFSKLEFERVFVPNVLGEIPHGFSLDDALLLFRSDNYDESFLGLLLLYREHTDKDVVWDEFINYLRNREVKDIPKILPYILAHIPWHQDIFGGRDKITTQSKEHAKRLFTSFIKTDYVKLLQLIDDDGIARGTVGQSIEVIISSIDMSMSYLGEIIKDYELPLEIRERASLIYAYRLRKASLSILEPLVKDSDIVALMVQELKQYGGIEIY